MFPLCSFLLVSVVILVSSKESHYHKISMVAQYGNQNKPALFVHAESPVWDVKTQSLYFVDVHAQTVQRLDYSSGKIEKKHIGYGQVNMVSLVAGSSRLLVAVRSALFLLDWEIPGDKALRLLTTLDQGMPDNVINEGKPDALGRFWAGTKGPQTGDDVVPDKASFYSISQDDFTNPKVHLRPVSISNGLVWSNNNSLLYYIDSPGQKIEAFDYDLTRGEISGRRTIIDITEFGYDDAIPDGITIDYIGDLWVALMFGGTVLHIDPDARAVVFEYKLPAARVTALAWGGPALDELFVTSARDSLDAAEALGGAVFTIRGTGRRGLQPHAFRFDKVHTY